MTSLEELIQALAESFGAAVSRPGLELTVDSVAVDLPLEARIGKHGLEASLPRGILATGFDPQLGRIRFRLEGASE